MMDGNVERVRTKLRDDSLVQDRASIRWRIIYDAEWCGPLPYRVEYEINRRWCNWAKCYTRWGARWALWRGKRSGKPIGGEFVIYEEQQGNPDD